MYLAIDPGIHAGWCALRGDLSLHSCGIGEAPEHPYAVVLCERPTVYPYSRADPANIITLAINAGDRTGRWRRRGARVEWVEPRTWKGNIDKAPHHAAIVLSLADLPHDLGVVRAGATEVKSKKYREDMMDAVGLALYGRRMHLFRP